ncbi:PDDEXK nuclease domain-containing protein [Oerskovia sp. M15]
MDEFYVDLLFFHVEQLRYVVVELKIGSFEPGHLGQLGTYIAIIDDQLRRPQIHAPTIGILLCTGKSGPIVKYALASTNAPSPWPTTKACQPKPATCSRQQPSSKPSSKMSSTTDRSPRPEPHLKAPIISLMSALC